MQTLVQMTRTVPFPQLYLPSSGLSHPPSQPPPHSLRVEVSIRMNEGTVRDVRWNIWC